MPRLVEDVRSLIEAFGHKKCVLVAHDWGGFIAWNFAYAHSEMVDRLVIMNAPHPLAFRDSMTLTQILRSFYMFVFQLPWFPEIWLRSGNYAFLRGAFMSHPMGVKRRDGPLSLTEDDLDVYMWTMQRAGTLTAAVNYYRNIFGRNAAFMRQAGIRKSNPLKVPTLLIWGKDDAALGPESPQITGRYCSDFRLAMIENASHWVQQDAVQEVIDQMADYLHVTPLPVARITGVGDSTAVTTDLSAAGAGGAAAGQQDNVTLSTGMTIDGHGVAAASGGVHERKKKKQQTQ